MVGGLVVEGRRRRGREKDTGRKRGREGEDEVFSPGTNQGRCVCVCVIKCVCSAACLAFQFGMMLKKKAQKTSQENTNKS